MTWRKKAPSAAQGPVAVGVQAVAGVGQLDQVLRPLELVPVEVQRVERPVAVVGAVDQQLGLGQPVAVGERVDHLPELGSLGRLGLLRQPALDVVVDLFAVLAPDLELVRALLVGIEHDDDHRGDRDDTVVDRAGQPGRPAPLRAAGHDEPLHRPAFFLGPGLQRVHGPDRTFGHRKEQRPVLVLGLEVADECLGDQLVLFLVAQQRLVGDLAQDGDSRAAKLGQHEALLVVVVVLLALVAAARDEQEHGIGVGKFTRVVNRQLVLPGDPLPDLRGQRERGDGPARRVLGAGLRTMQRRSRAS